MKRLIKKFDNKFQKWSIQSSTNGEVLMAVIFSSFLSMKIGIILAVYIISKL